MAEWTPYANVCRSYSSVCRQHEEECLFAVLRQAIECRSAGNQAISLMLLEWLRDQDAKHLLVIDSLIRGLVACDRFWEASALLSSLANLDQGKVLQQDIVRGDKALQSAFQFLLGHSGHVGAFNWLSTQHDL